MHVNDFLSFLLYINRKKHCYSAAQALGSGEFH